MICSEVLSAWYCSTFFFHPSTLKFFDSEETYGSDESISLLFVGFDFCWYFFDVSDLNDSTGLVKLFQG